MNHCRDCEHCGPPRYYIGTKRGKRAHILARCPFAPQQSTMEYEVACKEHFRPKTGTEAADDRAS